MEKITPCLWFNSQAEEAANFYVSIFSGIEGPKSDKSQSKIISISRYGEEAAKVSGMPKGSVLTVIFQLRGQQFVGLNGGSVYTLTPAISFMVDCETQDEVDWFWDKLSEGGKKDQCGWLHDRFGVSWQVVPTIMGKLFQDKNSKKSENVMRAMLQMQKLDIGKLKQAYEQG